MENDRSCDLPMLRCRSRGLANHRRKGIELPVLL